MTTITTGTSGPKAWKIALVGAAAGLAALVVVNLPTTTDTVTGQQGAETATANQPESAAGFEYGAESTPGHVTGRGVTTQYLGNSGELFPYENGSAPVQAPPGFGGPVPEAVPDQATIDAQVPAITQEFLDGPSSGADGASRVDPGAAVAAGLYPGAIDAVVGGTEPVASAPDNLADARARAAIDEQAPAPSFAGSDDALARPVAEFDAASLIEKSIADALAQGVSAVEVGVDVTSTNARWEALQAAYENGTISSYYTGVPVPGSPQWQAFIDAAGSGSAGLYFPSPTGDPLIDERVDGDPHPGGASDDALVRNSTSANPADVKFLENAQEAPANGPIRLVEVR
jgi:hypothetical protein